MAVVLKNSALLNAYYDQRVLSSLPNQEAFFQFGQIDWAYDLIETVDGVPSAMAIDPTLTTLNNVFYTSNAAYSYVAGNIVITASIPAGALGEGVQQQFSCVGIKDTNGNYVAVSVVQPVWVYDDRSVAIEIIIETARSDTMTAV